MKKILVFLFFICSLLVIFTACESKTTTDKSTLSISETLNSDSIVIDDTYDAGFGYKFCRYESDSSGMVGIANEDGSILFDPEYISVLPVSADRFIARKFVDQKPHSALIDKKTNEIIPFFRGEINWLNSESDSSERVILSVEPLGESKKITDSDGKKITDKEYILTGVTDGKIYGTTEDGRYFYDMNGSFLFEIGENPKEFKNLDYGFALLATESDGYFKYGVADVNGNQIISCEYDVVTVVSDDCIIAKIGYDDGEDPHDITRMFNGKGERLTDDWNTIYFEEGSETGFMRNIIEITDSGYKYEYANIDKSGNIIGEKYIEE